MSIYEIDSDDVASVYNLATTSFLYNVRLPLFVLTYLYYEHFINVALNCNLIRQGLYVQDTKSFAKAIANKFFLFQTPSLDIYKEEH